MQCIRVYTTENYTDCSNTTVNRWQEATACDAVQAAYNNNTENDEDKACKNVIVRTLFFLSVHAVCAVLYT